MKPLFNVLAAGLLTLSSVTLVHAKNYGFEGGGSSSLTGIVPQTLATYTAKDDVNLQVVLGQSLTKSIMKVAANRLDLSVAPPPAVNAMKKGVGPYAGNADQAKKLSGELRSLFGFSASAMHAIVWADSGIETWGDLKGKRVFVGPPAGAAAGQSMGMIQQASGLTEDDYEAVKLPWGSALQGFKDGQFDVYIGFYPVGSQIVNEMSLLRPIRLLHIESSQMATDGWKQYEKSQAAGTVTIPANTYSGQVNSNQDVNTGSNIMMVVVNRKMDDNTAYTITKAFWQNLDVMKQSNALMRPIDPQDPFAAVNAPLHPGAAKYYQEQGFTIPSDLL